MTYHFDPMQSPSMDVHEKVFFHAIVIDSRSNLAQEQYRCVLTTLSRRTEGLMGCYETRKIIKDLGLSYKKIHACPKNCILYWKENAHFEACPNCNRSRWESNESKGQQSTNASSKKKKKKKKKPAKILRWFPLKPRLQ